MLQFVLFYIVNKFSDRQCLFILRGQVKDPVVINSADHGSVIMLTQL